MKSVKIEEGLFLCELPVGKIGGDGDDASAKLPTHHIMCLDVSYSMAGDLPKMRKALCDKLPKLLGVNDTCSLLYFSGRGEFGLVFENVGAANAKELQDIRNMIERWLVPIGLTGFKEPLVEVEALCKRVTKANSALQHSLFFMSDGCDNQWDRSQILAAVERAAGHVAAATFVEYGYYADRKLLSEMADKAGGKLVFAEQFDKYEPVFEKEIAGGVEGVRVEVKIPGDMLGGVAFAGVDGDIVTYAPDKNGKIFAHESAKFVYFMAPTGMDGKEPIIIPPEQHSAMYAALSVFSVRMQSKIVRGLLRRLGDAHFMDEYSVCFGKQKLTSFMEETKNACFDNGARYLSGMSWDHAPPKDAFTILELLTILQSDERNRVLLDHSSFKYSRISRARLDAEEMISEEDQEKLGKLAEAVGKAKTKAAAATAQKALDDAREALGLGGVKFTADPAEGGYGVNALVWNENRPNVSIQVMKTGSVDLAGRIPEPLKTVIPEKFPTKIVRNYAIIRDGLVNVATLPVLVTDDVAAKLVARTKQGVVEQATSERTDGMVEMTIDLKRMPILNQDDVTEPSAAEMAALQFELQVARARQKVFNYYCSTFVPRVSKSFVEEYGKAGEEFLKSVGVKDYGFSPVHTVAAESKDFIVGRELNVTMKGYMTLPKVEDVKSGKKIAGIGEVMKSVIDVVEKAHAEALFNDDMSGFEEYIEESRDRAVADTRSLLSRIARAKFAMTVGQVWFKEWTSMDDCKLQVPVSTSSAKTNVECVFEMKDVQINV